MPWDQVWILAWMALAVALLARTDRWHRWGYVAGLLAQPAFLYATWIAEQWGMFALTWWITASYACGAYNRFKETT